MKEFKVYIYTLMTIIYALTFVFCFSSLIVELMTEAFEWSKFMTASIGILSSVSLLVTYTVGNMMLTAKEELFESELY